MDINKHYMTGLPKRRQGMVVVGKLKYWVARYDVSGRPSYTD